MIDVYAAVPAHGHGLQLKSLGPRRRRAQIAEYVRADDLADRVAVACR